MQVFLAKERLGKITQTGNSTVKLSASVLTLGSKQYSFNSLTCDITSDLDTGVEQNGKYYYVYFVDNGGAALVCSLNSSAPSGYSRYKKVGAFVNNFSGNIEQPMNIGEQPTSSIKVTLPNNGSTNTRSIYWTNQIYISGIGISRQIDTVLGDKFVMNDVGELHASLTMGQTTQYQEQGIVLNYTGNDFISSVQLNFPEQILCSAINGAQAGADNNCSATKDVTAGDFIKAYTQVASGVSTNYRSEMILYLKSKNAIDWL